MAGALARTAAVVRCSLVWGRDNFPTPCAPEGAFSDESYHIVLHVMQ
jgi:hypothetical protein